MFESSIEDYLNNTTYTDWSILSILEHVDSKKKIYIDDIGDLKYAIYSSLRRYRRRKNILSRVNTKLERLLKNYDKTFGAPKVKLFLNHLRIREDEEDLQVSVRRNMTATYTVEALKDYHRNKNTERQLQSEDIDHTETLNNAPLQNTLDGELDNMLDENIQRLARKRRGEELPSTPPNKIRTFNVDAFQREQNSSSYYGESDSDSGPEVVKSIPLTNVFLDVSPFEQQTSAISVESVDIDEVGTDSSLSLVSEKDGKQKLIRKYIGHDLADEVLSSYKIRVMP
ncbi:3218_t:CDS:2, partial [Paraglomus occultum]